MDITYTEGENLPVEEENVLHFWIVLENNHNNTYHPGQILQGHVHLKLRQNIIARGILIQFMGRAAVSWPERTCTDTITKCTKVVNYKAVEEYFNVRNFLYEPGSIPASLHELPFKFQLTPPLPESYQDNICQIDYYLEARLKKDTNILNDYVAVQEILLLAPINLNEVILPDVTLPVQAQKFRVLGCCCCKTPPIVAFLRLPRSGYAPGERIPLQADIENNSKRHIKYTTFSLIETRKYITKKKTITQTETIVEVKEGPVMPFENKEWKNIAMEIPKQQLFNVSCSKIFQISHHLEMNVHTSLRCILTVKLDITLGAIGLDRSNMERKTHLRLQTPRKHIIQETSEQFEAERKKAMLRSERISNERAEEYARLRRKDRGRKVYPENFTVTEDYRPTPGEKIHDDLWVK